MKTLRKRRPVDELSGSEVVDVEQPVLWSTARHLDETITLQGFYCLHDCRWPGTRNGSIDQCTVVTANGTGVSNGDGPRNPAAPGAAVTIASGARWSSPTSWCPTRRARC